MTSTVERGVVRQVWMAPASNPSDKSSFLIRDDAYSKREATFGRTMRLGDPVDLGPFGQWRQTNWSGGMDQESWKDPAMYELANADVSDRRGAVKLWNGFTGIGGLSEPPNVQFGHITGASTGFGDDNPLLFGERLYKPTGVSAPSFRIWKWVPGTSASVLMKTASSDIQAMGLVGDSGGNYWGVSAVGYLDGSFDTWNQGTNVWTQEVPPSPGHIGARSIVSFNDSTYYFKGNDFRKRTFGAAHSVVKTMFETYGSMGCTVWNNRIWGLLIMSQGRTGVFVSDGFTVQMAFILPRDMIGVDICPHYGSLYIRGFVNYVGPVINDIRQVVYKYNGSSLSLLWEDDDSDLDTGDAGGLVSWGRYLVWSKHGSNKLGRQAGVWLYDAEEDSIMQGPSIDMDPSTSEVRVSAIASWNNTLAVSFFDKHTYTATTNENPKWIGYLEKSLRPRAIKLDGTSSVDSDRVSDYLSTGFSPPAFNNRSFGYPRTTKTQAVLSSSYDGGLPGEKKVWCKGYLRCRVPQGTRIRVVLLHDDSPTEHPVKTVTYSAGVGSGWQDLQFPATCTTHGILEKSGKVRYKLYVENIDLAGYPNNTPEVDAIGIDFLVSPERRAQYHLRVLADDNQTTLAGTANPLTTRDAIVAKLTEYWEDAVPILFWEPSTSGTTPVTTGKLVQLSDFLDQPYRITSDSTEVASEVSFNLLEVA